MGVQQKKSLDIAKFLASLAVIAIHCPPFPNGSTGAMIADMVSRMAVPLFFAISGFLFFEKIRFINGKVEACPENIARLRKYIRRIGVQYCLWSAIYILYHVPGWYQSGWWGLYIIKDCMISFFCTGVHYHLWYLPALMIAIMVLYMLLSWFKVNHLLFICTALWLILYASGQYADWAFFCQPVVSWIIRRLSIWWSMLFCAVPLLYAGVLNVKGLCSSRGSIYGVLVAAVLYVTEVVVLRTCNPAGNTAFVLTTPVLTFFVLSSLLSSNSQSSLTSSIQRKASEYIYFIHPIVAGLLSVERLSDGFIRYTAVSSISVAICIGFVWVNSKSILATRGKIM